MYQPSYIEFSCGCVIREIVDGGFKVFYCVAHSNAVFLYNRLAQLVEAIEPFLPVLVKDFGVARIDELSHQINKSKGILEGVKEIKGLPFLYDSPKMTHCFFNSDFPGPNPWAAKTFRISLKKEDQYLHLTTITASVTRPDGKVDNVYDYINSLSINLANSYKTVIRWECEGHIRLIHPAKEDK